MPGNVQTVPQSITTGRNLASWQTIDWSDDQLRRMYTDWGTYFASRRDLNTSTRYLDAALEIQPNDANVLNKRSAIRRMQARAPEALSDCLKAKKILSKFQPTSLGKENNLEFCDALYECNQFEDTKLNLHKNLSVKSSSQANPVLNRLKIVDSNFHDALREVTAPAVHRLVHKMNEDLSKEPTSVKSNCDVLSIMEKPIEHVSPLEVQRRKRLFKIYNQTYLNKSWTDVSFLKDLRENPNLLLKQFVESTAEIKTVTEKNYKSVRNFTKMLHARYPMYSSHMRRFPNKDIYLQHEQESLYRIQYQTKRNMYKILRIIRSLIANQELQKLTSFVDEVTGDYVTIKTHRIMPWKFEFINEVYNYLGLARISEYKIAPNLKVLTGRNRLLTLFNMPISLSTFSNVKEDDILNIRREQFADPKAEKFKKRMGRFEQRMRFAKHPLERSYLYHEAAQCNLEYHSFDTCCLLAGKSIDEALKCNNYVWAILGAFVACKAHAVLGKVERQKDMLTAAAKLAKRLNNIDLCLFIDICLQVNNDEIDLKKMLLTPDFRRRNQRSGSTGSAHSFDESRKNSGLASKYGLSSLRH